MLIVYGLGLSGSHLNPHYVSPRPEVWRTKFPGLPGEGEIYGRPGGRPVEFVCWVYPFSAALLNLLDGLISSNGEVIEVKSASEGGTVLWSDMTFDGWEPILQDGRPGPFYSPGGTYTGWYMPMKLSFYQLLAAGQAF